MAKLPRYQDSLAVTLSGASNAQAATSETRADTLDTFRKTLTDWAVNRQTQRGKIAGAAATGPLTLKKSGSAFAAAFNDAATRNYFIEHYIDSETELGRIEAESQSPQEFQARSAAVRQEALSGAVPEVKGGIRELYDKRIGEGVVRLQAKQIGEQKDLNRTLLESGVGAVAGHISRLLGSQGEGALPQVQELEQGAQALIEGAVNDGTITPAEAVKLRLKGEQDTLREYTLTRVRSAIRADPAKAQQELLKGGFSELSAEDREAMIGHAHAELQRQRAEFVDNTVGGVTAAYQKGGPDAGVAALGAVQNNTTIPPELRSEVLSKVNANVSQLRVQRQQEHADDLSAIARGIATDTVGPSTHTEVDSLYQAGVLSPEQRAAMHAQVDTSIVQGATKNRGAAEVAAALAQGIPLDPRNADQRKALGAAFDQATAGQQPGTPSWQGTAQAWTQRTRLVPEPAISWTRAALRSPDPALAAGAAQFLGAVQAAAPDAVGEFDSDSKALGGLISSMIEAGTAPDMAVETARANVLGLNEDTRKRRQHAWDGAGQGALIVGQPGALNNYVDRDFDPGWFSSQPENAAPGVARATGAHLLSNDFDAQTERYFLKTGDINVARDLAWNDVKRVYGPSKVNGGAAMMAFPPEMFHVEPKEIRAELAAFVAANPQADGSTADDLLLVPDSLTLRSVGDAMSGQAVQPSYAVVGKSGDLVLDSHGVPMRWTIPGGEELGRRFRESQAAAAAEAQKQVDVARAAREARLTGQKAFADFVRSGSASPAQD